MTDFKSRAEKFLNHCFNRGYPDLPLKRDCQFDIDKFISLITTALQEAYEKGVKDSEKESEKIARMCGFNDWTTMEKSPKQSSV